MRGRRSVREFHADPVSPKLVQELIEAAAWAPSAVDAQALTYFVIEGQTRIDDMSRQVQAHALRHLSAEAALDCFRSLGGNDFHAFYNAPAIIVIAAPMSSPWAVEDACLAAQNLMLAAYQHQIGSCWIGFAREWLRSREGRAALDISEDLLPVAPIAIGWPRVWPSPTARRQQRVRRVN
jgi:nitroreductase